jgi:adenine-specific DNA-methyltransferase
MFEPARRFNAAILNPPYKKISSDSDTRRTLREIGVETTNLYTGFLAVVLKLLVSDGQLVAITPRSFCNGPYFKPFRKLLLDTLVLRRIHVFESRHVAFAEDEVLQENVIFCGEARSEGHSTENERVVISSSTGPEDDFATVRQVSYNQLVRTDDPEYFIHIVPDELGASISALMSSLPSTLPDIQIEVSTGRVVDFRATQFLRQNPSADTVPLIYPRNLENGLVQWPKAGGKKPQAMAVLSGAEELLVAKGTYVLVKRFTSKEENRRVVAAVYDPKRIDAEQVGFENHTNYYHRHGGGLPVDFAKGLAAFLNSTIVDMFFRQFNGHTQVNASDLRSLKYPTSKQLELLGTQVGEVFPDQDTLDALVQKEIFTLADTNGMAEPVKAKNKIDEALAILKVLDVPREQQNERSALTLLSLLDLKPDDKWAAAKSPLMGITPMMDFFREHYGKEYAPNTRETVRRQTIHQFRDAGIVVANPDEPSRPVNSPKAVYQIEAGLLELLKTFGADEWEKGLKTYLSSVETLKKKYAQERDMQKIPLKLTDGKTLFLTPGGQNLLVEQIVNEFCPRFTAGGLLLYIGDTGDKFAHIDKERLEKLGVTVDSHGKMPDVIVYVEQKNWLVLIEAVTSHGPINPKRMGELKALFKGAKAGLVFVTTFLDRSAMVRYLPEISWETEVWVADAPSHMIHFNGERFLGPYEK